MSWLTTQEAADRLGVTRQRVGQMLSAGELEGERLGVRGWRVGLASVQERAHQDVTGGRPWSADTLRDVVTALSEGRPSTSRAARLIVALDEFVLWRRIAQAVTVHRYVTRRIDRVRQHLSLTGESAIDVIGTTLVGESRVLHGYPHGVRRSQLVEVADMLPVSMLGENAQRYAGEHGGEVAVYDVKTGNGSWVSAPVAQRALVAADCARSTTTRVHSIGTTALGDMRNEWLQKNVGRT